jgi:hypothetical protein
MMRKAMYTLLISTLFYVFSFAQITIDATTFPVAGDTLMNYFTVNPPDLDLLQPGEDLFWDFSALSSNNEVDVVFLEASEGLGSDNFPNADLVSIIPPNNERYLVVTAGEVAEVGFIGFDPIIQSFSIVTRYSEPYVLQRAPLQYGDMNTTMTEILSSFPFDSIPDTLVMGLPIRPDSIRVRVSISQESEVDAWGNLKIPAGTFEVLREHTLENRTTSVDAYTGLFGWQDVTDLISTILPNPEILNPILSEAFVFRSNMNKSPIASITVDTNGTATQVQFLRGMPVSTSDVSGQVVDATLSPNPTYGKTTLYYNQMVAGEYELVVYDILGTELMSEKHFMDGSGVVRCDFTQLPKGTYLYSLKSSRGDLLMTKRLVRINP